MKVSKYLWSNVVLIASFFINRIPSTPLGGEIPLRRLRPGLELFSIPPRVFGCIAFVLNLSLDLDKLSPRSDKCVFVGYSRTHRGYHCILV